MNIGKINRHFRRSAITMACAVLFCHVNAQAVGVETGVVEGRVTDSKNSVYFAGAQVQLKSVQLKSGQAEQFELSAVTRRDGSFRFRQLADGQYRLVIHYIGAESVEQIINVVAGQVQSQHYVIAPAKQETESIIVYGQLAGQAGAMNLQKNANSLMSIVSADAIGQLPDQNAAEALQRLPGLFIERDQGEGRFIGIRGIDPNLNNVTINGVNVPSPEAGVRSVAMDVIPSELIQSLQVSKTLTPDMDASAVGGSIEVKSLSAFDRQGQSYSLTAQNGYNQLMSENSPKLSGSFSDIYTLNDGVQLGIASAVSWLERKFGSQNLETDGGWANFEYDELASGEEVEFYGAEEIEQRFYQITRERLGAAINVDLYTSSTDKYYLRTLYSQFSDDEVRLRNEYKFAKGQLDLANSGVNQAQFVDAKMDRTTKDRFEKQKILSLVFGGENHWDDWLVQYHLGYSKSSENEPDRIDASFAGEGFDLGYRRIGAQPQLTQSTNADDLSLFELDELVVENNSAEDQERTVAMDFSRDFLWHNNDVQFKFGAKHRARKKFNQVDIAVYDGGFDGVSGQDFAAATPDYGFGHFGPGLSVDGIAQYVADHQGEFNLNDNETLIENAAGSYRSKEDINAAYAMVSVQREQWLIVTGLRYEATSFTTVGNKVELTVDDVNDDESVSVTHRTVKKDYSQWLPSVNVRYMATDDLVARFAYTQTIARPTFGDSAAFALIESEIGEDDGQIVTERKAEVGNPELNPYESNNLDLSLAYYPGRIGVLSAGLFYKDIDNFITQQQVQDNGQWQGFSQVIQQVNGGSAELTGLELAWSKNFDSGLFFAANATLVDSQSQLPNQADKVANFSVGYQDYQFSLRLSANYKSESFQFDDNDASVYQDSHSQWDLSAKYYVTDSVQLYFNAINLADEPYYLYHGQRQYNYQFENYGRSFELGVTLTSF